MRSSIVCVILFATHALAQQSAPAPSADELTRAWVEHMAASHGSPASTDQQKYTYLVHHHEFISVQGQVNEDSTDTSEQTFIGGQTYTRLLEKDGKPLKGRELKQETELNEQAVRERTGLSPMPKARKISKAGMNGLPREHLVADFSHKITGAETMNGHLFVMLELRPLNPDAASKLQRHIRVSIDPESLDVEHFWVEYLASSDGFSKGTIMENTKIYFDGTLLPASDRFETFVGRGGDNMVENIHILSTDTYGDYKRVTNSTPTGPTGRNTP